jgi:CheY-like chemotaxis protein
VGTINDILDVGKLDNHALTLSPVTAPLGRLVARSVDPLRIQADAAGLQLDVSVDPAAAFVKCDPDMLQRVIQNLLSNATKFTPRSGTIRLRAEPATDGAAMVVLSVTDTGVGIPAEALTHIAERYFRAGSHATGSGLGLAISKEIVVLHGGTFAVVSPPPGQERGTRVTITIPTAPAPHVLVVDDDPAMQDLIARQLGPRGYNIEGAGRGETALKRIESGRHDVVIMDLVLEGMSGADVILAIKSSSALRYIPILAVTGATIGETTAEVLTRFSIPTLPKPWKDEDLVDTIESILLGKTAFQVPA